MAEDLKHLLAQLRIEKCILIGHSMGGKTAMATALTQVSGWEMSPWVYCNATVPPLDVTWPFSLYSPVLSGLSNPPLVLMPHLDVLFPFHHCFFFPQCDISCPACLPQSILSLFVVWFSGEVGGSGHQSSTDIHLQRLPLLHPSHAGGEDLHWHPTFHRQTDGWGSATQFGWGQHSLISAF